LSRILRGGDPPIKNAIANIAKWPAPETFQAVSIRLHSKSIIHCVVKILFASDVPLRGLIDRR
jgi:hypothetical protein